MLINILFISSYAFDCKLIKYKLMMLQWLLFKNICNNVTLWEESTHLKYSFSSIQALYHIYKKDKKSAEQV